MTKEILWMVLAACLTLYSLTLWLCTRTLKSAGDRAMRGLEVVHLHEMALLNELGRIQENWSEDQIAASHIRILTDADYNGGGIQ